MRVEMVPGETVSPDLGAHAEEYRRRTFDIGCIVNDSGRIPCQERRAAQEHAKFRQACTSGDREKWSSGCGCDRVCGAHRLKRVQSITPWAAENICKKVDGTKFFGLERE